MLDIFHKLPSQAKKFLETHGERRHCAAQGFFGLTSWWDVVIGRRCCVSALRGAALCRRATRHSGADDRPRGVTAQASRLGHPLQAMVPISASAHPFLEPLPRREVHGCHLRAQQRLACMGRSRGRLKQGQAGTCPVARPACRSVSYFIDAPSRLANDSYFARLLDIVRRPEGAPLLTALSEAEDQLVAVFDPRPESGQSPGHSDCGQLACPSAQLTVRASPLRFSTAVAPNNTPAWLAKLLGCLLLLMQIAMLSPRHSSTASTSCTR